MSTDHTTRTAPRPRKRDAAALADEAQIALVCRAIAEPSRRAMLDLLAAGPCTTQALAAHFPTTRFATMKHLEVLVEAGLVVVRRSGRERWNYLNAVPLQRLHDRWVAPLACKGAASLLALQQHLEEE
jgi:DNA-binding transcriptional ArsR family regulator